MAMLDEHLVEEWLNRKGYFTMRGVKSGVDEIDFLALKYTNNTPHFLHVEVQISFRPIGYLGGNSSAKSRDAAEIKAGVQEWIKKKFTSEKKIQMRASISPNADWQYMFVCANLKKDSEPHVLDTMKNAAEKQIEIVRYSEVLKNLQADSRHQSSSIASDITELLKYLNPATS